MVTAADPKGRSYPDYVEEEIFAPLGLENSSIGRVYGPSKGELGVSINGVPP